MWCASRVSLVASLFFFYVLFNPKPVCKIARVAFPKHLLCMNFMPAMRISGSLRFLFDLASARHRILEFLSWNYLFVIERFCVANSKWILNNYMLLCLKFFKQFERRASDRCSNITKGVNLKASLLILWRNLQYLTF